MDASGICVWLYLTTGLLGPIEFFDTHYSGVIGQLETPLGEHPVLLQVVYGDCNAGLQPDLEQLNVIPLQTSEHVKETDGSYFEQHPGSDGLNKP